MEGEDDVLPYYYENWVCAWFESARNFSHYQWWIKEVKAERIQSQKDELFCHGNMLNTLSNHFYDLFPYV